MTKSFMDFLTDARQLVEEISVETAAEQMEAHGADLLLLDVREPDEVAKGHIPMALNVPRGLLEPKADLHFPNREPRLENREQHIIVYCASGARSMLAAATLRQMGFSNVQSMAGGIAAWQSEGRDIVQESW